MKIIAFFNNKGGVGKTSLVYHLAYMFAEMGRKVLAVDLDPQANLTSMFLDDERLIELWEQNQGYTIVDGLDPLMKRTGDILALDPEPIIDTLSLIPGNLALSRFEDLLSENWAKCLDGDEAAFRVITAFYRIILQAAGTADIVLIDVGPNLGAINRSALLAAQYVVIPLAPDLFSLQGLRNLGPTLRDWRKGWKKRLEEFPESASFSLPSGEMNALGYVIMQHSVRESSPVKAFLRWMHRIPEVFRQSVLSETGSDVFLPEADPYNLALLKHYRSLMPMAMDARKPMFYLKPADGAIGAHVGAVRACHKDFRLLAESIEASIAAKTAD